MRYRVSIRRDMQAIYDVEASSPAEAKHRAEAIATDEDFLVGNYTEDSFTKCLGPIDEETGKAIS